LVRIGQKIVNDASASRYGFIGGGE